MFILVTLHVCVGNGFCAGRYFEHQDSGGRIDFGRRGRHRSVVDFAEFDLVGLALGEVHRLIGDQDLSVKVCSEGCHAGNYITPA